MKSSRWRKHNKQVVLSDWDDSKGYYANKMTQINSGGTPYKRCWEENHKPLKILKGEILGASCSHPAKGYDIYIGLDHGMHFSNAQYPWAKEPGPLEFMFPITDMCAPKDVKNFKLMISWMVEQLSAGKRIHIGCIGGHGRTGLVLSALVKEAGVVEKDIIQWVRKHHCKKAVESVSQITFLVKHYGASRVNASKGVSKPVSEPSKVTSVDSIRDTITHVISKGRVW